MSKPVHPHGCYLVVTNKIVIKLIRAKITLATKCYVKEGYRYMQVKLHTFLVPKVSGLLHAVRTWSLWGKTSL